MKTTWFERLANSRPRDFFVGPAGDPYMERWWLIPRNPIFCIYLHRFWHDDDSEALHDHPWMNVSILLQGTYREITVVDGVECAQTFLKGDMKFRLPSSAHRIEIDDPPVWSLFLRGPVVRTWGFHCPKGWVPWQIYTDGKKGSIGKGCGK